ncbi:uncharacterized protein LOC103310553 [Acyrthosiphon pisum]|uniref:DNA-directed DNA polymerase n=1 Tax=Acyrthosiphon pisum TaxID=7029 RepID=A0A8R2FBQ2_ACYPI|nr:uncharacterized protein LOC103310553 [Acyrthosiphon pisum]|eukprot:XP_008187431.1 PREDICTED: uncharacterized protein LOC103310553 [Acyrthosiphon pisum]
MAIYRQSDLSGGTIAVVQNDKKDNFSDKSIKWLKSKILNENKNIKHALNGGEVTICGARVDGYHETEKKVYQYHGCFWHGCPDCFNSNEINPVNNNTMSDLYNDTIRRTVKLTQKGYQVEEMWSCKLKKHQDYKQMMQYQNYVIEPLNPRDAFFGGRTNATKLMVKNKKIKYIDVCSLYPTVMYYDTYPVGHPKKIFNPSIKKYLESNWYGFIKCKILPPTEFYHSLETSSWKNDYRTVNDYISAVKNSVGIDMDIENIKENPGLRALAKICLN